MPQLRDALEVLVTRLAPHLDGAALEEVLNRLLWLTDDNGAEVITVCREWLGSGDRRRVEAALSINECWLYDDRDELDRHLQAVLQRWPDLAPRVRAVLDSFDDQHGRQEHQAT